MTLPIELVIRQGTALMIHYVFDHTARFARQSFESAPATLPASTRVGSTKADGTTPGGTQSSINSAAFFYVTESRNRLYSAVVRMLPGPLDFVLQHTCVVDHTVPKRGVEIPAKAAATCPRARVRRLPRGGAEAFGLIGHRKLAILACGGWAGAADDLD
jgi:hypothetical protein